MSTSLTRRQVFTAMAGLGAVGVAGCSQVPELPDSITGSDDSITIWVDTLHQPVVKPIAGSFLNETGIEVKVIIRDDETMLEEFVTLSTVGRGPDAILTKHVHLGELLEADVVTPIRFGSKQRNFARVSLDAMAHDNEYYGVPMTMACLAMIRNLDLAPDAAATLDDLVNAANRAVASEQTDYSLGLALDSDTIPAHQLYGFQSSLGADLFKRNNDGSYRTDKVTMGGTPGRAFASWLERQGQVGLLNPDVNAQIARELFFEGRTPFYIVGPEALTELRGSGIRYAIEPIPRAGDKPATPFVEVFGAFISSNAKNPSAAKEFLVDYLASTETTIKMAALRNHSPANENALLDVSNDRALASYAAAATAGVPTPWDTTMKSVWEPWSDLELDIIKGKTEDPEKAWDSMVSSIKPKSE